jgi:sigma-B regulation protein RsbU (phosphoserine phosphatase)
MDQPRHHDRVDRQDAASTSEPSGGREQELLATLFDLGRQIASVLDLRELLQRIPELIGRLIEFEAFAVYLTDDETRQLRVAYSAGYPADAAEWLRLEPGQGLVGISVAEERPVLVNDVTADDRYVSAVPGMRSELVVPLRHMGRTVGALNLLSERPGQFTARDAVILQQFGAHAAVAIVNARLFAQQRRDTEAFAALADIAREMSSILDLDELLTRLAQLTKRVIDYRTFGIFLLNDQTDLLEIKLAVRYDEKIEIPPVRLGEGLVGYAALQREPVLVADVSKDPRYIKAVEDVRSELAIPMLLKDRCVGVFDLESPELDAFGKRDIEILTPLASQAAVAVENARLYEAVLADELRLENELEFAQRVQAALLPADLPKRMRSVDVAGRFEPARELGGDFHDYLSPEPNHLVVAVGDVSGKGVPAALYGVFAGELVRGRTFRRRFLPERSSPAGVLSSINTILHERQLEEYYCTVCYAAFDLKRRTVVLANSGLPYPLRCTHETSAEVDIPGVPLGAFPGSTYDELTFPLEAGDLFVFFTDGISETMDAEGQDFGVARIAAADKRARQGPAAAVVDAIFEDAKRFRGDRPAADDMTVVVVRYKGE